MDIHSLLSSSKILSSYQPKTKHELLVDMIQLLSEDLDAGSLEAVREAVLNRESIMSTGVGKGLAIPHGKTEQVVQNYAVFARLTEGIEYESIDDIPVRMVFLLVGPTSKNSTHIKLLSRISRLMNSATFRDKILECETTEQILEAFTLEEQKYFPTQS